MSAPYVGIEDTLGGDVRLIPEPAAVMSNATSVIRDAVATMDADDVAALVGVATSDGAAKAAFVWRTDSGWSTVAWYERKDGQNIGGIGVLKTWKR